MTESLTISRTFAASPEAVFALWTDAGKFATWFGTDAIPVPAETLSYDAVAGASWSAVMHLPDGSTKDWVGEFVEVTPPSRFVMTLTDEPENPSRATVTAVVTPVEGGTELAMTQSGAPMSDEQVAGLTAGYNAFFDTMQKVLAS